MSVSAFSLSTDGMDRSTHSNVGAGERCCAHILAQAEISEFDEVVGQED